MIKTQDELDVRLAELADAVEYARHNNAAQTILENICHTLATDAQKEYEASQQLEKEKPNECAGADGRASPGTKYDQGKARFDLLPPSLEYVIDVFTYGTTKYVDWNWAGGLRFSRVFAAMMRHAWAWWWHRERLDPESRCPHLASVAWCALVLMYYEDHAVWYKDYDDRRDNNV